MKRLLIIIPFLLLFSCKTNELVLTDCQKKNLISMMSCYNGMEIDKVYKVYLCDQYFYYSFDGKYYKLKKRNGKTSRNN